MRLVRSADHWIVSLFEVPYHFGSVLPQAAEAYAELSVVLVNTFRRFGFEREVELNNVGRSHHMNDQVYRLAAIFNLLVSKAFTVAAVYGKAFVRTELLAVVFAFVATASWMLVGWQKDRKK